MNNRKIWFYVFDKILLQTLKIVYKSDYNQTEHLYNVYITQSNSITCVSLRNMVLGFLYSPISISRE